MEPIKSETENIFDHASELLDTYSKLTTVRVTEKATTYTSAGIIAAMICLVLLIILFFIGFGFAWWIGETMENMKAGFFIVGGVYAFLLVVLIGLRRTVLPILRDRLIRNIYDKQN